MYLIVFSRVLKKDALKNLFYFFFFYQKKLVQSFILKKVKPSPDSQFMKLLHLITCSRHYDILPKTRGRMATASYHVSRQNDASSRANTA